MQVQRREVQRREYVQLLGQFQNGALRLNTGIDPTSHWTSEQLILLARRTGHQ